jgi:lipopolysaccharide transport system permease protein
MTAPEPAAAAPTIPTSRAPSPAAEVLGAEPRLFVIEPEAAWRLPRFAELWQYREVLGFLAWRDIKVRYKQTLLGAAWAVLQPALLMLVFTFVVRRFAPVSSGDIPYPLFVYAGLVAWTFFATAVASAAQSVVNAERLVTKVYFPRLAIPLAAIAAAVVDFLLACLLLAGMVVYYRQPVGWGLIAAPLAVLLLLLAALGFGAALAALNVAYRDVRHVLPFLMQLWLFATPSVYLDTSEARPAGARANGSHESADIVPPDPVASRPRWLALNPLDGLIAFFRAAVLGRPLPWRALAYPTVAVLAVLIAGCCYFRRVEDSFADMI